MEAVRRAYGALAATYIDLFGDIAAMHPEDVALIERHLSPRPGRVLDVGCGPGHLTAHLASLGVEAIGIDLVPEFVAHARATHPDVEFECGSMDRLAVPRASIDGLLAWYSLIHLDPTEVVRVLSELRRVAAAGAPLVVGFFTGDDVEAFPHKVTRAYRWPVDELSSVLREAGFDEVERLTWPGDASKSIRPHATIAAIAASAA